MREKGRQTNLFKMVKEFFHGVYKTTPLFLS